MECQTEVTADLPRWRPFLQRWITTTLGVLVAANVVRGIDYDTTGGLLAASLLLGVLNAFLKPVMLLLSLPLLVATLGLFVLFINAFLLYVVGLLVKSFRVEDFWAAFWGALIISLVSLAASAFFGPADRRIQVRRQPPPDVRPPRPPPPQGGGPVIDV